MEYKSPLFRKNLGSQGNALLDKLSTCFFCSSSKPELALHVPGDGIVAICDECSKKIVECIFFRCKKCGHTKAVPEKEKTIRHLLSAKLLSEEEIKRHLKAMAWIPIIVKMESCWNCYIIASNN